jgi:hypothetical protein
MESDEQKNDLDKDVEEVADLQPAEQTDANDAAEPDTESVEESESVEQPQQSQTVRGADENPVSWTAQEYIHVDKNGLWYVIFALAVIALIALDIFVLRSYTFSALVVVMAVALVIYSRRPPRTIQYTLSAKQGLYVGEKLYAFGDFKAFGLIKDGEHHSIMLLPTKRFAPGVSVYFPEEAGEQIVDILGTRLPMQTFKLDLVDTIVRTLRL